MKLNLKLEDVLPILLGTVLVFGIFLWSQQEVSWAASGQHPDQQTIPPRPTEPPDPEPEPTDSEPEPTDPEPEPTDSEPKPPPPEDNDEDNDEGPPPPPPPSEPTEEIPSPTPTLEPMEEVPSPTPALEPTEDIPSPTPTLEPMEDIPSPTPTLEPTEEISLPIPTSAPQEADLSLIKTVDNPTPKVGDEVSFTITLQNSGPGNATNVAVSNPLPAGLNLISVTPGRGNFNKATGLWSISAVSPDQSVILNVVAEVINTDSMANTAEIIAADQFDPDSTPGNGLEGEDDQADAPIKVSIAIADRSQPESSQPGPSDDQTATTSATGAGSETSFDLFSSLNWLYVLGMGLILILGGVFLANRS